MSHGTSDTGTGKRDEIPYPVLVVAIKQIAEIEHHLLIGNPVLITVALVGSIIAISIYKLTPDALNLGTETDTRSIPLAKCQRNSRIGTELLERVLGISCALFLGRIPGIPICTNLIKPVAPKRIGSNTVFLLSSCVLSE